jgi:hypothetical protein
VRKREYELVKEEDSVWLKKRKQKIFLEEGKLAQKHDMEYASLEKRIHAAIAEQKKIRAKELEVYVYLIQFIHFLKACCKSIII